MEFKNFKLNSDGLIPVVVQDYYTKKVLMVAYMNEEAYNKTLETNQAHYYSRSRNTLWLKGEMSGHLQNIKSISIDCDNDTILLEVEQIGVACHTGNESCFYTKLIEIKDEYNKKSDILAVLNEVYDLIVDRKNNPKEGSYTNYLFAKGIDKILKKVGEETAEVIIGAKNEGNSEVIYEISDLLYHLSVLMVEKGVSWKDIMSELDKRR